MSTVTLKQLITSVDTPVEQLAAAITALSTPSETVHDVDEDGLVAVLMSMRKAVNMAGLIACTEPPIKCPKTTNKHMAGRITKLSHVSVAVGDALNYGKIVNGRREKLAAAEGWETPEAYEVQPRKWGTRVPNTPFVVHRGQLYLETLINRVFKTEYRLDGNPIAKDDIAFYLQERTSDNGEERTGVEVVWRDYKVSSIRQVTVDGHVYQVV